MSIRISKRIAEAYTEMGQLSSAILEYETVLQRRPNDTDVQTALQKIEDKAGNAAARSASSESAALASQVETSLFRKKTREEEEIDDGRKTMRKVFVESKVISAGDFDLCWHTPDLGGAQPEVAEPFIQVLGDKGLFPLDKSLRLLTDKSRTAFLPFDRYDADMDLLRGFPAEVCRRWCVAPFDRMSKSILVATANPFNRQAARNWLRPPPTGCCGIRHRPRNWSQQSAKPSVEPWPKSNHSENASPTRSSRTAC